MPLGFNKIAQILFKIQCLGMFFIQLQQTGCNHIIDFQLIITVTTGCNMLQKSL